MFTEGEEITCCQMLLTGSLQLLSASGNVRHTTHVNVDVFVIINRCFCVLLIDVSVFINKCFCDRADLKFPEMGVGLSVLF